MKYPTIFDAIHDEFLMADIPFVLIGGFAMNAYGIHRNTKDVDFLILDKDFGRANAVMIQLGYRQLVKEENFAQYRDSGNYQIDLDLMFVDAKTLGKIIENGQKIKIAGKEFIVPGYKHLIALKLHALKSNPNRQKDLLDIVSLVQFYKWDIHSAEFKSLCRTFGTEKLYEKIKILIET
ncbi:MAG: nucleotidyltransferase family protein [Candidatus Omnitrophica bacterium]|nr:nucleotidyltransferase family protein [Candidatus Omnitrophota bacterium]